MGRPLNYTRDDFDQSPMLVFYEVTRACDLKCQHCRADAQCDADPGELSTAHAKRFIAELKRFPKPPLLVFTGGDPLKRRDIFELVAFARSLDLTVAMTPSATPLVTPEALRRLADAGLNRFAVSLDGASAESHDGFRGVAGSFQRTLDIARAARAVGLPVQINTTVSRSNVNELESIADLIATLDIELWSVFFLIPTGRGLASQRLSAEEVEDVFARLHAQMRQQPYAIKTTEAPHFRRFLLQQTKATGAAASGPRMVGLNDGKGVMFVSHTGQIFPSGFLPILAGTVPLDSVVRVYQQSKVFQSVRDADQLGGKCGECEFRHLCGGSRARAFAITGDPLAEEPDCIYQPAMRRNPGSRPEIADRSPAVPAASGRCAS